jgi:tetratricopeptide (TPR) repeat protein
MDPAIRSQKYFDSGMKYFQSGKLGEAAIQFRNALKVDPKFAEAGTMLAKVQLQRGEFAEIYKLLLNAIMAKPDYLPAHVTLGFLYLAGNRVEEAGEEVEYVLERAPNDVDVLLLQASWQAVQKDFPAAEETLNRALKISPSHRDVLFGLAAIKVTTDQPVVAESLLKQVIANAPDSADGYLRLAGFYVATDRASEAEPLLQKAVTVSGNSGEILEIQARYYLQLENWAGAEKSFRRIGSLHGSKEKYWAILADFYMLRGEWDKAHAELERVLREHPDALVVMRKLVEVRWTLDDEKGAEELNNEILRISPQDALAHLAKGRLLIARGDITNALLELNETKKYQPDLPALHLWYAQVHSQRGDLKQAKQALGEALRHDPSFWLARLSLAELQNRTGEPDAALTNVQELLKRNPRDMQAYLVMSQAYLVKKDFPQAERILKAVVEEVPENAEGRWQFGLLRLMQGNFVAARQQLGQAWHLQPESEPTLQAMVMSYMLQRQPRQATEFLQQQISGRPTQAFLYHALGEVYRLQNKRDDAIRNYTKALTINPEAAGSAVALANLYVEGGDTSQAIRLLLDAAKRKPQDVSLALSAALALDRARQWQEAQSAYERVIALDNGNVVALNNLAWLLAENGGNVDVALKLAQQAKERAPENVDVTDTVGWLYYKKNSFQMALNYFEECTERNPSNPVHQYHLGMTYLKLDRKEEGRRALRKALEMDPQFSESHSARQLLAQL